MKTITAGVLEAGYLDDGAPAGWPVVLSHGFPYDGYQHLFQTERGRRGLTEYRRELCRMLWQQWSPGWEFADAPPEAFADAVLTVHGWLA